MNLIYSGYNNYIIILKKLSIENEEILKKALLFHINKNVKN